jgi:hypothetical protein
MSHNGNPGFKLAPEPHCIGIEIDALEQETIVNKSR